MKKEFKYIAFNKPFNILSQFTGGNDQNLSKFNLPKDVYAVGRLDKDSEGLLILSNDGAFIDQVLSPKFNHKKTYLVQVERVPGEDDLNLMRRGLKIKDYKTRPCEVSIIDAPDVCDRIPPIRERKSIPTCWLKVVLTEGKNRQVRRMTAAIGFPTLRLIRVQVNKYSLLDLNPGEWIELSKSDIL